MADQLPGFQDLTAVGAVSGIAGIALIAEEAAALVAREVADMGGGKYQFHPDELQAVLKQWQGLQNTITAAKSTVHVRVPHSPSVMMPGNEQLEVLQIRYGGVENGPVEAETRGEQALIVDGLKLLGGFAKLSVGFL